MVQIISELLLKMCEIKANQYYAVSIAVSCDSDLNQNQLNENDLIFTDKTEALNTVKKYKGSRFKAFSDLSQAIQFVKETDLTISTGNSVESIEKSSSPFSGPHPRDLTKLRKAIEKGDQQEVKRIVWSNPRYLVSSGDTPVILMEGPRYNACHIAAKESKANIVQLILNIVSDKHFMKLLYPLDTEDITQTRIDFLLDLYLNTPEKGFCETPLHFGCKFGSIEVVSTLLRYQICDRDKCNKFNKKASEIICQRKGDNNVKAEILKQFQTQLYIPLIRDDCSAKIGQPFKGEAELKSISGLAGPMSPKQADTLFNLLKSPKKCTPNERKIRLTDSQRGLERVARNLCKEMNVNWIEFWPFLNQSIDLSSNEGLNLLDKHLSKIYYKHLYGSKFSTITQSLSDDEFNHNKELKALCNEFSQFDVNSSNPNENNDSSNEFIDVDNDSDSSDASFVSATDKLMFSLDFYIDGLKISKEDIDAVLAIHHRIEDNDCLYLDFVKNWFYRVLREKPEYFNDVYLLSNTSLK